MSDIDELKRCANCRHQGDPKRWICGKGFVRAYIRDGGARCVGHEFPPEWREQPKLFEE